MSDKDYTLKTLREDLARVSRRQLANKAAGRSNLAKMDGTSIDRIKKAIIELGS